MSRIRGIFFGHFVRRAQCARAVFPIPQSSSLFRHSVLTSTSTLFTQPLWTKDQRLLWPQRRCFASNEDFYSLLGVNKNASQSEIKKAFFKVTRTPCRHCLCSTCTDAQPESTPVSSWRKQVARSAEKICAYHSGLWCMNSARCVFHTVSL